MQNRWITKAEGRLTNLTLPLILGASSFLFLLHFAVLRPTNGDTYVYARSISTFQGPVIHYGYFLLGHVLHGMLGPAGISALMTLGYMSCLFGSLSATCMYFLSLRLTGDRIRSLVTAVVLLFSGDFWLYAEHGEVYVPEFFFVILSALLVLYRKPLLSALSLLIAISITPTSCLALPGLLYLLRLEGYDRKKAACFAVPIALGALALLVWRASDVIVILRSAIYSPSVFLHTLNPIALIMAVVARLIKVYGKAFNVFSLLALYGFVLLLRRERKNWLLMLAFTLPFLLYIFNMGLFSGDHLIISFLAVSFLASAAAVHLGKAARLSAAGSILGVIGLVILHAWISYQLFIGPEIRDASELQRVSAQLEARLRPDGILLSKYDSGMSFWYTTQDEPDFSLLTGRPHLFLLKATAKDVAARRLEGSFWVNCDNPLVRGLLGNSGGTLQRRRVYFMDTEDSPSWLVKRVLPSSALEAREPGISRTFRRVQRFIGSRLGLEVQADKVIDSPLYPVYEIRLQ